MYTSGVCSIGGESGRTNLDWATLHDHLLDGSLAHGRLEPARERVLVRLERARESSLALSGARRRRRVRAAWGSLSRVRVVADGAVVVAVGEGEVRALLAERAGSLVLTSRHGASLGNVRPRRGDLRCAMRDTSIREKRTTKDRGGVELGSTPWLLQ